MLRRGFEKLTGYWIHKARFLPVGADLRIDLARAGVGNPQTIFDVGANIGQTYARFRRDFPGALIHSFEPVRNTFNTLRSVVATDPNARAEHLALGANPGSVAIKVSDQWSVLNSLAFPNSAPDVREESVRIDTVDNYCRANGIDRVDLLKIDTEGYEIEVLQGAISVSIAAVFCEVGFDRTNARHVHFTEIADILGERGFAFYGIYDVTHYPHYEHPSFGNALFVHRRSGK